MFSYVVKEEGVKSLYRSLPVTVVMNIPNAGLFMTLYENMKSLYFKNDNISLYGYLACAGLSSSIAAGMTTPLDVIKTRL